MRVIAVRRAVVGSLCRADGEGRGNTQHVPATLRRIAVQILKAKSGSGHFSARQLSLGIEAAQANAFQGFTDRLLGGSFLQAHRGKCRLRNKSNWIREVGHKVTGMARGKPGSEVGVKLLLQLSVA